MATLCPQCGKTLDGGECQVCVARIANLQRTFFLYQMPVGCVGFLGMMFALLLYPPLGWDSIAMDHILDFIVIPGAIVFLLLRCNRLARYAPFVKLMSGFASATLAILAAFIFLNGALDGKPGADAQAFVSNKSVSHTHGASLDLELIIEWDQKQIKEDVAVRRETYSAIDPGDSVSLTVHSGAFSTPWYGNGHVLLGNDAIKLNSR